MTKPSSLDELFSEIKSGTLPLDDNLPTYGSRDLDAVGVWSWDDDRRLVGTCVDDLRIEHEAMAKKPQNLGYTVEFWEDDDGHVQVTAHEEGHPDGYVAKFDVPADVLESVVAAYLAQGDR